jgi:threonine/homoserine/homoserine lactone efflux protein
MSIEHWLAFAAASAILVAIPGPTVLLVVSYALGYGRRSAAATVAGVALGDFTAMTASMIGLGALLSASATVFLVLKWIGAAYLIWLGIKLWRAPVGTLAGGTAAAATEGTATGRRMFLHAFTVTALNPKSIVFFVAFLPQFLLHDRPIVQQMAVFEATFVVLAALNAAGYAFMAAAARRTIRRPSVQRAVNRVGGSLLIAAGAAAAAAWRRT